MEPRCRSEVGERGCLHVERGDEILPSGRQEWIENIRSGGGGSSSSSLVRVYELLPTLGSAGRRRSNPDASRSTGRCLRVQLHQHAPHAHEALCSGDGVRNHSAELAGRDARGQMKCLREFEIRGLGLRFRVVWRPCPQARKRREVWNEAERSR